MKNNRNNKGITLVALVITIIIMLILVIVTINIATNGGIISKAQEAKSNYSFAEVEERINLAMNEWGVETALESKTDNEFKEFLIGKFESENVSGDMSPFTVRLKPYVFYLSNNGAIEEGDYEFEEYKLASREDLMDDDLYPTQLKPFITVWKIDENNETITLPLVVNQKYNCEIDYGDGTEKQIINEKITENVTHTYEKAGEYKITITGSCPNFNFATVSTSATKLKLIKQWGAVGFTNISFNGCTNLTSPIAEPVKNSLKDVTNFSNLFCRCSSIEYVPEKLFYNIGSNSKNFSNTFMYCSSLKEIPENLFSKCQEATSFGATYGGCFYGCSSIEEIPENLFANNQKVTAFGAVFSNCTNLKEIPEKLFVNNTVVTDFGGNPNGAFANCTSLTEIPEELFANCAEVKYFSGIFNGCKGLTGPIPENLFTNCTKVTSFTWIFNGCTSLAGAIPENLFANCPEVTSFYRAFYGCKGLKYLPQTLFANNQKVTSFYHSFDGCSNLEGAGPNLWDRTNVTQSTSCFSGCRKLSNYTDIPSTWK